VHTLEPELRALHAEGVIDDATVSRTLARDRRVVFSLHHELRAALYTGVLLVMAGVGMVLAPNLDRIGPLGLVLAASLAALAGWFGVGGTLGDVLHFSYSTPVLGSRALVCAVVITAWRYADRRARPNSTFTEVFDHFAANLAFWGAIAWCLEWPWLAAGLPLLAGLAYASVRRGLGAGREAFLVYGIVYAAIGLCAAVAPWFDRSTTSLSFVLIVVCAAAASLWQLRRRLRGSGR
jgi:hypothetical protein